MQINIIGNHFAFMDSAMLLHIPAIFTAEEVSRIRAALEQAEWADGKATAGYQSAKAKHNLQLPQDHPLAREIGEAMLQRLWNHPLFMSAALPLKVFPPLFNCYTGGARSTSTSTTPCATSMAAASGSVPTCPRPSSSATRRTMTAANW